MTTNFTMSPTAELTIETLKAARDAITEAVTAPTRGALRMIRRRPPAVEPYPCCAPRAGTFGKGDQSKSWFCKGTMHARGPRTIRYEGDTLIEVRCDECGRESYAGAK